MSPKREPRDYYRHLIYARYRAYLDKYPHAARQIALALCGLLCSRIALEDLQEWSLALTLKAECPFLLEDLDHTDASTNDRP